MTVCITFLTCRETLRVYVPLGPTIVSQLISAFIKLPSSFRNSQNVSDHYSNSCRLLVEVCNLYSSARSDIVLPFSSPIIDKDGNVLTEIVIPNNTNVIISILGINRDPSIWGEDAAEWKPERWLSPLPSSVLDAHIPGVYANMWGSSAPLHQR
jgi:Cytochrome P450